MFVEVEIKISDLVHDLRAGLTWLTAQDKGHGSIQAKYEMEDEDVIAIQSHPAFNQPIRTFKIVDDYTKKPAAQPIAVVEETAVEQEPQSEASYLDAPAVEETESAGALEFLSL